MSVLIKGGRVITAADDYVGDVLVDGERISLIGESLDVAADRTIDASGKYVLPGCIDPHTPRLERRAEGCLELRDQRRVLRLDVNVRNCHDASV
jgi:predicted amidohydrolase YtcJ